MWAGFISCVLGLSYAVSVNFPGKPSVPTEYPEGLERELGGPGAVRVSYPFLSSIHCPLTCHQAFQKGDPIEE